MQKHNLDDGWLFKLGDPLVQTWRTQDPTDWQHIDIPHDWSIGMDRSPDNPCGSSGGFFPNGMGWYRKTLSIPSTWQGKTILIEFEGVYMNAEVWINGNFLGRHPYGYTSFTFDLSPYLDFSGGENTLDVSVDNAAQRNSRWYSGSGIYRHVWLWVGDTIHIAHWGTYITTPHVSPEAASVIVRNSICNTSDMAQQITLQTYLRAQDGTVVGQDKACFSLDGHQIHDFSQTFTVHSPHLWSTASPYLYVAASQLIVDDQTTDKVQTPFGIRSLEYSAEKGFLLNGTPTLLKGGCVHHDNGVLGAASFDRAEERKVEVLKQSGYNAIRCAHNPPAPGFLDACDRLGMLVIDEAFDCWREGKNAYDYHVSFEDWWQRDLDSMLVRDRNHPSIIMWSIGNEVLERAGHSGGIQIARELADYVRQVDPTRPVTSAINGGHDRWPWEQTDAVFDALDVGGYNYQLAQYLPDHERVPSRIMVGTESTAGEAFDHWMAVLENPFVIGDFVWTSLDYLGEAGIGRVHYGEPKRFFLGDYPWHQANCGDLDLCGVKRPQSYYRDILWHHGEKIHIFVHDPVPEGKTPQITYWGWPEVSKRWTWPGYEGQVFTVDVYAACDEVELLLNGVSIGKKPATKTERYIATFHVPYAAGALTAIGYNNGSPVIRSTLATTGEPAKITLSADRETLQAETVDLSYITVDIVDADGNRHYGADQPVFFTVKGEGILLAVGNGNPTSTENYAGHSRRTYQGRCLVVVKTNGSPGEIHLRAMADGLESAEILLHVE